MDQPQTEQIRLLTPEERNDLRQRVLRGETLTLDEARQVYLTLRQGQATAATTGEKKRGGKRKAATAMSDDELNNSLDSALGL